MVLHKYYMHLKIGSTPVSKYLFGLGIIGSLLFNLWSLGYGIYLFGCINIIPLNDIILDKIAYTIAIIWHLGEIYTYLYLLHRLHYGFRGTQYSVSIISFIIITVCLFIYTILCGTYIRFIVMNVPISDFPFNGLNQLLFKITIFGQFGIHFILSNLLLGLFIYKLLKVGESIYYAKNNALVNCNHSVQQNDHEFDDDWVKHRDNIYIVVTKVSILGIIMMISSVIVLITWTVLILTHNIIIPVIEIALITHTILAPLCLLFGFDFTKKWYNCCFGKCHKKIQNSFIQRMDKKILNIQDRLLQSE